MLPFLVRELFMLPVTYSNIPKMEVHGVCSDITPVVVSISNLPL